MPKGREHEGAATLGSAVGGKWETPAVVMTGWLRSRPASLRAVSLRRQLLRLVLAGGITLALTPFTSAAAKPGLPSAGLLFNGAFTQDTLRPWSDLNVSDRVTPLSARSARTTPVAPRGHSQLIKIVRAPGRERGRWAVRFTVIPKSRFLEGGSYMERSEIMASPQATGAYDGRSGWYGWATYFPRGFKATPHHYTVIAQAHSTGDACLPPNLYMAVNTQHPRASAPDLDALQLITFGGPVTDGLAAGACSAIQEHQFIFGRFEARHWFRFVMHVMWSSDPNVGYIELWVDGRLVVPLTHVPTLYASSPAYWKQGLYEFASPNAATDYQLGVRVGSSYGAVAY